MLQPRIGVVESYEDEQGIRGFVRRCLRQSPELAHWLRPDPPRHVVVKPNWIQESNEYRVDEWVPVITHPNLILGVMAELAELMDGVGTVSVCDAPHTYADFGAIQRRGGFEERLAEFRRHWPRLKVEIIDLRREVWIRKEEVVVERRPNAEDPRGYVRLDLGRDSWFYGHRGEGRYYGADYDSAVVNRHHRGDVHEYLLAGTPVACDLFVNLPKLKTHKKTGITCCLKNLVGINGDKNWLPHHTEGSPNNGGDEFPRASTSSRLESRLKAAGRRVVLNTPAVGTWVYRKMRNMGTRVLGDSRTTVRNGNWHGNDTCWRMALDLNRALLWGRPDGTWGNDGTRRRYLAFVDGIVGGQGDGPLAPTAADSGVLLFGDNPAVVDAVAAKLMGYEPSIFPIVRHAFEDVRRPVADRSLAEILVDDERVRQRLPLDRLTHAGTERFALHFGWQDYPAIAEAGG